MDECGPDYQQQMEAERERYEMTVDALNRCAQAGARVEDLKTLARECGITNYQPHADRRTASVG
jgi:hypothetical protein